MTEKLYQTLNKKLNNLRSSAYKDTQHQLRHNRDKKQPSQFQFHSKIQELDGYPSFIRRNRNTGIRNSDSSTTSKNQHYDVYGALPSVRELPSAVSTSTCRILFDIGHRRKSNNCYIVTRIIGF